HKGLLGMRSEALLFMASRAQLVDEIIAPSLEQGKIVISDRYLLANLVYQGYGGGLNLEDLRATGNLSTGGVLPNLTFVLDIPVEIARKRIQRPADRMEQRSDSFFEKVRQGFLAEAALAEDRMMVINASESVEIVQGQILSKIKELLGGREIS
ncbi:MAG: dTMP kinase, partial [Planctomycetia bacterium]